MTQDDVRKLRNEVDTANNAIRELKNKLAEAESAWMQTTVKRIIQADDYLTSGTNAVALVDITKKETELKEFFLSVKNKWEQAIIDYVIAIQAYDQGVRALKDEDVPF